MDELDEIEFMHDTRMTLTAALEAVKDIQWEIGMWPVDAQPAPPGWEPFAVERGVVYYRRPAIVDEP